MFWAPQAKYISRALPLGGEGGHGGGEGGVGENVRQRPKAPSPATGGTRLPPRGRAPGDLTQRIFSPGVLAPVLDGGETRSRPAGPGAHSAPAAPPPLRPIVGLQGARAAAAAAEKVPQAPQTRHPRQPIAPSLSGREGQGTPRLQPRSRWPKLDILAKDVAAMKEWYAFVEAPLSGAFPDARCPYVWLEPGAKQMPESILAPLAEPYSFRDCKASWDFPDDSKFAEWCEEMMRSRQENVNTCNGAQLFDGGLGDYHEQRHSIGTGSCTTEPSGGECSEKPDRYRSFLSARSLRKPCEEVSSCLSCRGLSFSPPSKALRQCRSAR